MSYEEIEAESLLTPTKERLRVLGRGSFGVVQLCFHETYGRVAVKCNLHHGSTFQLTSILNELDTLKNVDHDNVVKIFGTTDWEGGHYGIVMQYYQFGNLTDLLLQRSIDISLSVRESLCRDIARGIRHMHELSDKLRLIHGDLKPDNVLLDDRLRCKITDFGSAIVAHRTGYTTFSDAAKKQNSMRTKDYAAPERWEDRVLDKATDVYSNGMIVYAILSRNHPPTRESKERSDLESGSKTSMRLIDIYRESLKDPRDQQAVECLADIVQRSCLAEPRKRMSMAAICLELDRIMVSTSSVLERDVASVLAGLHQSRGAAPSESTCKTVPLSKIRLPPQHGGLETEVEASTPSSTLWRDQSAVREITAGTATMQTADACVDDPYDYISDTDASVDTHRKTPSKLPPSRFSAFESGGERPPQPLPRPPNSIQGPLPLPPIPAVYPNAKEVLANKRSEFSSTSTSSGYSSTSTSGGYVKMDPIHPPTEYEEPYEDYNFSHARSEGQKELPILVKSRKDSLVEDEKKIDQTEEAGDSYGFAISRTSDEYEAIYFYDPVDLEEIYEYVNEDVEDSNGDGGVFWSRMLSLPRTISEQPHYENFSGNTTASDLSKKFVQQCTSPTATSEDRQAAANKFDADIITQAITISPEEAYSLCRVAIKCIMIQRLANGADAACQLAKHAIKICNKALEADSKRKIFTQCSQALNQVMEFHASVNGRYNHIEESFLPTLTDIYNYVYVIQSISKRAKARDVAWCASYVAHALYLMNKRQQSREWLEVAKSELESTFPEEIGDKRSQLGHVYHDLARCYESSDEVKAEECLLRARTIFEQAIDWPTGRLQDEKQLCIDTTELCLAKLYITYGSTLKVNAFMDGLHNRGLNDVEQAFMYIKMAMCMVALRDYRQATKNIVNALSILEMETSLTEINFVASLRRSVMMTSVLRAMLRCLGNQPEAIKSTVQLIVKMNGMIRNGDYRARAIALCCEEMFNLRHLNMSTTDRNLINKALEELQVMSDTDGAQTKASAEIKLVQSAWCKFYATAFEKMHRQTYGGELREVKTGFKNIIRQVESGLRSAKSKLDANQCRVVGECYQELAGIYVQQGRTKDAEDHLKWATEVFLKALDWESDEDKKTKLIECASFDTKSKERKFFRRILP